MSSGTQSLCFEQLHVDVARNASDDFNPFHDPHRWHRIRGNPFDGPIVLGFQLECLVDHQIEQQRRSETQAGADVPASALPYSSFDLHFASALRPDEPFSVQVRRTLYGRDDTPSATNRVMLRKEDGNPVLLGSRSDTTQPGLLNDWTPPDPELLASAADRSFLPGGRLFLKRKYLTTSNGKNFLVGSLVDQYQYFDELSEHVLFPPVFPTSLLSCALLERGWAEGCDFEGNPQIYVSHRIVVDRRIQQALRSNDQLDMIVDAPAPVTEGKGLSQTCVEQQVYRCLGVIAGRGPLFRANLHTAALKAILDRYAEEPSVAQCSEGGGR